MEPDARLTARGGGSEAARPLRVLHIAKFFPPHRGGMESFVADLATAQAASGQAVTVLAYRSNPGRTQRERLEPGIALLRAGTIGQSLHTPLAPRFAATLRRAIEEHRPDVLHLHMPNAAALAALRTRAARALPWVVHWHADVEGTAGHRGLRLAYRAYRPFETRTLRRAAAVIATSQAYASSSPSLSNWSSKTVVIPVGVDRCRLPTPTSEETVRAASLWPDAGEAPTLRVLCVGRMTFYKGHQVLLDALRQTPQARALLVGEGPGAATIDRALAAAPSATARRLRGVDNRQLAALYTACDVVVLPSTERAEAFGVVLLEAMAAGRPAVAANVPGTGMRSVLGDGSCGIMIAPGSAEALAAALRRLYDEPELRRRLGAAGRTRFESEYAIGSVAERITALYRRVLAR